MYKKIFSISFEYFPPKIDKSIDNLIGRHIQLMDFDPIFVSLTYGAGGGSSYLKASENARKILPRLMDASKNTETKIAAHITAWGKSKQQIANQIAEWFSMGIRHFVALRGDKGQDDDVGYFSNASDLVAYLRKEYNDSIRISVAAYPEGHIESSNLDEDIGFLCDKFSAGADDALTQFFYDANYYTEMLNKVRKRGYDNMIIPGLLPIHNPLKVQDFANKCGASIPSDFLKMHLKYDPKDNPDDYRKVAEDLCFKFSCQLLDNGAKGLHFFTLNKSVIVEGVCEKLKYSYQE